MRLGGGGSPSSRTSRLYAGHGNLKVLRRFGERAWRAGSAIADARVRLDLLVLWCVGAFPSLPRIRRMGDRWAVEQLGDVVDETLTGVLGRSVLRGIHPNRILGASFHAKAADDAAKLVDHEGGGELFDHSGFGGAVGRIVLAGLDVNALGGADGGAHVASDAARFAIVAGDEPMQAAITGWVGDSFLGVLDGGDETGPLSVEHARVGVALAKEVAQEVAGRHCEPAEKLRNEHPLPDILARIAACVVCHRPSSLSCRPAGARMNAAPRLLRGLDRPGSLLRAAAARSAPRPPRSPAVRPPPAPAAMDPTVPAPR